MNKVSSFRLGRLAFVLVFWLYGVVTGDSAFPILLTLPTLLLVMYGAFRIPTPAFSSDDMFWLCCLFFFVVAPCQAIDEYGFQYGPTSGLSYEVIDFVRAEIIIFVSLFFYVIASRRRRIYEKKSSVSFLIGPGRLFVLTALILLSFGGYVAYSGGIANVLLPRAEKVRDDIDFVSIIFLSLQTVGTALLAINASSGASRRHAVLPAVSWAIFLLAAVLLVVSVNPLNSSRFFNIATWLPIILAFAGGTVRYKYVYVSIFLGILVLMPITSLTTRMGLAGLDAFGDTVYAADTYILKDMDVFDTMVHGVRFMDDVPYYLGDNLKAIVLFFVPRAMWPDKPVVGGLIIGDDLYQRHYAGTPNLSYYVAGDMYMDFGYVGVAIGFLLIGLFAGIVNRLAPVTYGGRNLVDLFLMASLPILMRGPLGAVIGYFSCLFLSLHFYNAIFRIGLSRGMSSASADSGGNGHADR